MISTGTSATTTAGAWSGITRTSTSTGTTAATTRGEVTGPTGHTIFSGEALLRERVFGMGDSDADLPRYTQSNRPVSGRAGGWLTTQDRVFVSALYEQAQATGRSLRDVDNLAKDLDHWRSTIGPQWGPTVGSSFNENRDPTVQLFDPANEKIAQRIRGSQAMYDSGLPTEFLVYQTDPGRGGTSLLGLGKLENLLYELSTSGAARSADGGASLPERTPDILRRMLADGSLQARTAEMKRRGAENPWEADWRLNDPRDLFEKYEERITGIAPMLQEDDKAMLGAMYAETEEKHGVGSDELKKVDALARKLATMRMTGMLLDKDELKEADEASGSPRKTLAERGQDAYDKAMREPVKVDVRYVGGPVGFDERV